MSEENMNTPSENEEIPTPEENGTPMEREEKPLTEVSALFEAESEAVKENTKKPIRVSLTTFICTTLALVLAAVMLTYTLCSSAYQARLAEARLDAVVSEGTQAGEYDELELLSKIFKAYSFEELDDEKIKAYILKAYVRATGDKYAEYYTEEEYKELTAQMAGDTQGIGINIINSSTEINGVEYKALKIVNVMENSPAHKKSDLKLGDYIVAVGTLDEYTMIDELGYDMALKQLQGVKGTVAEFVVYRESEDKTIPFSITRDEYKAQSVMYRAADIEGEQGIGVIKITQFDLTTPGQVKTAIESLQNDGCDKFVFDVRYNPGGELTSIVATLSLFLEEGDTVISVKDNAGNEEITRVEPVVNLNGCSVAAEDIGIFKDLEMVVLCNGSTASAAELFVANFRDHELGTVVGTTTYGKGSMQSHIDLAYFGYSGVLKLTRHMYYPPNGESYDGIGIEPTVTEELSAESAKYNVYDIWWNEKDNQLIKAVEQFK